MKHKAKNYLFYLIVIFASSFGQALDAQTAAAATTQQGYMSYSTVLLINDKSEILLLRRKNTAFAPGLYSLPGGRIEPGETTLDAAIREAKEEIGVTVEQLSFVHVVDRKASEKDGTKETVLYVFFFKPAIWHGVPFNAEPHKCDDLRWFPLDDLPENMIPAHRQAIILYQQGIGYSESGW